TAVNWWDKMVSPMRKVWVRLSRKISFRKTGLIKLHKDVRRCEYEDVHILWEMLQRNEADIARRRKGQSWKFQWTQCPPLLCR
ncbi:hypothetical protein C2S53_020899, partial [Perilla frutescens var. hirtella]